MKKLLFLSCTVFLLFCSCKRDRYKCTYEVSGNSSGGFDVSYEDQGGNTSQETVDSGWTYYLDGGKGDLVYISAQANDTNATVQVRIYWKMDEILRQSSNSGDYPIATASEILD